MKLNKKLPFKIGVDWMLSLWLFIPSCLLFILAISSQKLFTPNFFKFTGFFVSLMFFTLVWLHSFRITLDEQRLVYKTLFTKKKILYQNILDISVVVQMKKSSFVTLVLKSKTENVNINIAPFGKNISFVEKYLLDKCPQATSALRSKNLDKTVSRKNLKKVLLTLFLITFLFPILLGLLKSL